MDIRMLGKFSNIAQDIKFSSLVIFMVAIAILLHLNFRKKENILMQELKANETKRTELELRLSQTLKSLEPIRESLEPLQKSLEPIRESLEPLKAEIENLRSVVIMEKVLAQAQPQDKTQDKTNEIVWPVSAGILSEGSGGAKPLPKALPIAPAVPFLGSELSPVLIPQAGKAEEGLSRLKDYIQSLEEQNATLKKRSDDLNTLLNAKGEEIAKLSRDNLALKQDLENSLDSQKKLREELVNQIKQKDAEIKEGKDRIISLNEEIESLSRRQRSFSSALDEKQRVISILSEEVVLVRDDMEKRDIKGTKELREINAALKERLREITQELELLRMEEGSNR